MATKKELKQITLAVDAAFRKHGTGVQINMFDLSKISAAGERAGLAGQDIDAAVKQAVEQYRVK